MAESNTLISIIVPAYQAEKYLRQCVESVLAQTYSNWQLILVDDGSTDGTAEICNRYAASDSRITTLHKKNSGLSDTRNYALDYADGQYLAFLDADDMIAPGFLERTIEIALQCNADVVTTDFTFDQNGLYNGKADRTVKIYSGRDFTKHILYQKFTTCTNTAWAKLYRREIFRRARFKYGIGYEDLEIFPKIFYSLERVAYLRAPLYYYRQHDNSYLHTFTLKRMDVLDVTDSICKTFSDSGKYPDIALHRAALDRRMSAHFNILILLITNSYKHPELEQRCWTVIKQQRLKSLFDRNVRLKNKLGAIASLFGNRLLRLLASLK